MLLCLHHNINLNTEEKWTKMLKINKVKNISFPNLTQMLKYIFCLPGTSVQVEKVFFYCLCIAN